MAAPIICAACHQPFNASFAKCPRCGTAVAAKASVATRKCEGCQRPYNPAMAKCPFCGRAAQAQAAVAQPVSIEVELVRMAEALVAKSGVMFLYDFMPGTAYALDQSFDVMFGAKGDAKERALPTLSKTRFDTAVAHGALFGEIIRRTIGGTWKLPAPQQPIEPLNFALETPGGTCFPIARAMKRIKTGEEDGFYILYCMIRRQAKGRPLAGEADSWERHAHFFETTHRPHLALQCVAEVVSVDPSRAAKLAPKRAELTAAIRAEEHARHEARPRWERPASAGELAELAKDGERVLARAGAVPDYSPSSVAMLDIVMSQKYGDDPRELENTDDDKQLELSLGAYLGEVFVRRLAGRWDVDGTRADLSHVVWPSGFRTCPFTYISKRIENGGDHSVFRQMTSYFELPRGRGDMPPIDAVAESAEWSRQARAQLDKRPPDPRVAALLATFVVGRLDPRSSDALLVLAQTASAPADALALYDRALAVQPDLLDALRGRAVSLRALGRDDDALQAATKLLAREPSDGVALRLRGELLAARGDLIGAVHAFEALGSAAGAADVLSRVRCLRGLGRTDDALAVCIEARGRGIRGELSVIAAELHTAKGDLTSAERTIREAANDSQLSAEARAAALARADELAAMPELRVQRAERVLADPSATLGQSMAALRELVVARPNDAKLWRELSIGYSMQQRLDESLAAIERAIALAPDDELTWDTKAVTLARANRFPDAIAVLDLGMRRIPSSCSLQFRRGNYTARLGRYEESIGYLVRARELEPNNGEVIVCLADVLGRVGRTAEALAAARECLALDPLPPKIRELALELEFKLENPDRKRDPEQAQAWHDQALAHAMAGRTAKAIECFIQAAKLDPLSGEIWNNLGVCTLNAGQHDQALSFFERAYALMPTHIEAGANCAATLARLGRVDEALAIYDRLLARTPKNQDLIAARERLVAIM